MKKPMSKSPGKELAKRVSEINCIGMRNQLYSGHPQAVRTGVMQLGKMCRL